MSIDSDQGVDAHSDGDVLLHALTDALLGALALGDIGTWFPNDDPANRDRDSRDFVASVLSELRQRGWQPVNVDGTVFLQQPKLAPYIPRIRESVAQLLGLPIEAVSVKAKSGEGVGPVGRSEAVEAQVVILVHQAG